MVDPFQTGDSVFTEEMEDHDTVAIVRTVTTESSPSADFSNLSWPNLSSEQHQKGIELLQKHTAVFSQGEGDLGCTTLVEHEIPLTDAVPVRQRYRRLPPSQYEQVKAHIQELLDRGVMRSSCSPYSSPIVVVFKKTGEIRLCVDYRLLNAKQGKMLIHCLGLKSPWMLSQVPSGFPHWTLQVGTIKYLWQKTTKQKLLFVPLLDSSSSTECRLGYVLHPALSKG